LKLDTRSPKPASLTGQAATEDAAWSRLLGAANFAEFASAWLAVQATYLPPLRTSVLILGEPEAGPFAPVGVHPAHASISADLSIAAETALGGRKGVSRERPPSERDEGTRCVAVPLLVEGQLHGVIAVEVVPWARESLAEIGRRLQWGKAWVENQVRRGSFLPDRQTVEILDLVAMTMEAPSYELSLQGLANELSRMLRCDWAACGIVAPSSLVDVKTISHGMTISARADFVRVLAGAMQECADQREIITLPEIDAAPLIVTRAHEELAERGLGALLSVPLSNNGTITGVMTLKFPPGHTVLARDCEFCRFAGAVLGPLLESKRRDDRWIGAKVLDELHDVFARLVGPGHTWLKIAAVASVVVAGLLSVVTTDYRVMAPATLEGAVMRAVTAPIQGYIAEANARPGDRVVKDGLLARLDDRALRVERTRWQSELEQKSKEYQRAIAESERSRVQVLHAEMEQSQARIDLIEEQLARTEIRAPFEGIVVRGDLSQMLGAPVQRGDVLFEVAPLDEYRIQLRVDERDINEVAVGQSGTLILSSLPAMPLGFRVTKLTPLSVAEEGRNNFHVEAQLVDDNPAVRPGMQGYGKISVGGRKLTYIATAHLFQWVRMTWWRWWF
jgi:RND family efflux transporter MFP subunit